jgi:hypothetical protein
MFPRVKTVTIREFLDPTQTNLKHTEGLAECKAKQA